MDNRIIILVVLCLAGACSASEFATTLIYAAGTFGPYPYNDPNVVLGEPAAWVYDDNAYYHYNTFIACSLVYGAWNTGYNSADTPPDPNDPNDPANLMKQLVVTLGPGSSIIVGFDHKVLDEPDNPYGIDFIVFGNSAFTTKGNVAPNSDMDSLQIGTSKELNGGEKVKVEVAQEPNGLWMAFSHGPWGDTLFPTNRFSWDSINKAWGEPLNPLKPVSPNLEMSDFSSLAVSQAIILYDGSAGGGGFDLQWLRPEDYQSLSVDPQTGRRWIQYIKFSSVSSGEVDAVADVAPVDGPRFPAGDVNYDYRVDLQDFMILAENWLVCTWNCGQ